MVAGTVRLKLYKGLRAATVGALLGPIRSIRRPM